jgi:Flp pilus assembly protein TadB
LTQDELTALLNEAISRHSAAERQAETVTTLDDALDIARQLSIPEEHVHAAAGEIHKRRTREQRRAIVRQRRKTAFLTALAISAAIGMVVLLVRPSVGGLVSVLIAALPTLYLGWRASAPVPDEEADRVELPPVPGRCRVCGAEATTPRSTFCTQHQYQPPGA